MNEPLCKCGEKMKLKDSFIEKKTQSVSIEVMLYECPKCGNKEVKEYQI